eukprot:GHRR01013763.1.p2 GENE.GHRR01013763.1~~GHRR01013763.1.p2  ORF type:complete len:103 (+),score=25.65 GHRR01013763.1:513-821(+)
MFPVTAWLASSSQVCKLHITPPAAACTVKCQLGTRLAGSKAWAHGLQHEMLQATICQYLGTSNSAKGVLSFKPLGVMNSHVVVAGSILHQLMGLVAVHQPKG